VVVVGGGAAGTLVAVALLRSADELSVQIVERRAQIAPGLAYSTREPLHLLNNFAGRLSAFEDDPDHFVRWCDHHDFPVGPHSFAPRAVYGWYLSEVLAQAEVAAPGRLTRVQGEVVDIGDTGGEYVVNLTKGYSLTADAVVLALGNPPPRRVPEYESRGKRYIADPWAADLLERVSDDNRVLLVGSGLTTIDVAVQLAAAHPGVRLTAVSRRGLLPTRHVRRGPRVLPAFAPRSTSLAGLLAEVRFQVSETQRAGGNWRDVVDGLRPVANDIWRNMSVADRERFLRHVARRWEVVRHRMAPQIADRVDSLLRSGQLVVTTPERLSHEPFDVVVNCSGPAPVAVPGWNLLVDHLIVRGVAHPDRLGLGLDVDEHGALVGDHGVARGLYTVGAARRGEAWEVAAVPDLRRQVSALAAHLSSLAGPQVEAAG
jgi:uncharacterized NAD(P)/FAD-binding protein YdhS